MAISSTNRWEDIAAAKAAALLATIPPEWVIPKALEPSSKELDVTTFPKASGWFTPLELEITSSTSSEILSKVREGKWTAKAVTSAFCKRAAVAHQLVRDTVRFFFIAGIRHTHVVALGRQIVYLRRCFLRPWKPQRH